MTPRKRQEKHRKALKDFLVTVGVGVLVYTPIIWMLVDFFSKSAY